MSSWSSLSLPLKLGLGVAGAALIWALPLENIRAIAQNQLPFELRSNSYNADYFARYKPNTARDMVSRVPGFTLSGGGNNQRGFGQATLNILINGRRPSSKSTSAATILRRIPANKVIRIDIKDGASLDIPGLSGKVADIIVDQNTFSGSWDYAARFEEGTEPQLLDGSISVTGSRGNLSYVANLRSDQFTFTQDGPEYFSDSLGRIFEDRREDLWFASDRPSAGLNLTLERDNGHVANLNLSGELRNRRQGIREFFTPNTTTGSSRIGRDGTSIFNSGEDEYNYEISGDYTRPVFDGSLKLIGLYRFEDSDFTDTYSETVVSTGLYESQFDRRDKEAEYIARSEYSFQTKGKYDWQVSLEGAINTLDSTTSFQDSFTVLPLADLEQNSKVEELRTEGNITRSWAANNRLNLQTSIGAEYSRLDVFTSDIQASTELVRNFIRPKGFLSASYDLSDQYVFRTKLERDVGQLDFGIFVDNVDSANNLASSANAMIVPEQFWNGEVEIERRDDKAISGSLKLFARQIQDPIDRILLQDGTEAPGNLQNNAWLYGMEGNATFLMDSIGLDGMRLEAKGGIRDSNLVDPLTNIDRRINSTLLWDYEFNLRHDIKDTPYAYGASLDRDRQSRFFRLDQTLQGNFDRPNLEIFATHKSILGLQASIKAQNLFNQKTERPRFIYGTDRTGNLFERQNFARQNGRRISLELSGTF